MIHRESLLILCLLLTGCGQMLKTEYKTPEISVPASWKAFNSGAEFLSVSEHWWQVFGDPLLSSLINETLKNNNDLIIAALKLQQSKLDLAQLNRNRDPDFALSAGANNSRIISTGRPSTESYSSSLSMNYELDLWGKLARAREQGARSIEASEEDLHNTALVIIGSLSEHYWTIAKLNHQIEYYKQRLEIAKSTAAIVKVKYDSGAIAKTDLLSADQAILSSELQLSSAYSQRESERNALALIYNHASLNRPQEKEQLDATQDIKLPLLRPVEIIALRPDIRAAELRIQAAIAEYDIARVNFFPTISLGATLSAGSSIFSQWFSEQSLLQSINAAFPLLQWGQLHTELEKSKINISIMSNDFRKVVLNALSEVENALDASNKAHYEREMQKQSLSMSLELMKLMDVRYQSGYVSLQTLLDAQDNALNQQIALVESQYKYLLSSMKFWLAIGGGKLYHKESE